MNERKKYQHYVPRFYLEGFQDDSGKLWCYDKQLDKAYQGSPDSLGGEKFFYDVPKLRSNWACRNSSRIGLIRLRQMRPQP